MQVNAVLHFKSRKKPHVKNFKRYIFALYTISGDILTVFPVIVIPDLCRTKSGVV